MSLSMPLSPRNPNLMSRCKVSSIERATHVLTKAKYHSVKKTKIPRLRNAKSIKKTPNPNKINYSKKCKDATVRKKTIQSAKVSKKKSCGAFGTKHLRKQSNTMKPKKSRLLFEQRSQRKRKNRHKENRHTNKREKIEAKSSEKTSLENDQKKMKESKNTIFEDLMKEINITALVNKTQVLHASLMRDDVKADIGDKSLITEECKDFVKMKQQSAMSKRLSRKQLPGINHKKKCTQKKKKRYQKKHAFQTQIYTSIFE